MAEAIAERVLERRGTSGMAISAGTLGIVGRSAAAHAVRALDEIDLDLSNHRSQGISTGLLARADAIPIMTPDHGRTIVDRSFDLESSLVPLWRYTDHPATDEGITDPVGGDLEAFRECRDILVDCIDHWFDEWLED